MRHLHPQRITGIPLYDSNCRRGSLPLLPPDTADTALDTGNRCTLYVVDPDRAVRDAIAMLMSGSRLRVRGFTNGGGFLASAPARPGCALIELDLPDTNALTLLDRLKAIDAAFPVLIMTRCADAGFLRHAASRGADAVIRKPLLGAELAAALDTVLRRQASRATGGRTSAPRDAGEEGAE